MRVRRQPENARRGARRRVIDGLVTLKLDDGPLLALGHEAVMCANQVDGDLRVLQSDDEAFAHTIGVERRGARRHDSVVSRFQLAAQLLAFLGEVAGGPGQKHRISGGGRRSSRWGIARRGHRMEQSGEVLRDIVDSRTEHLERVRTRVNQKIPGAS